MPFLLHEKYKNKNKYFDYSNKTLSECSRSYVLTIGDPGLKKYD